MKKILPFIFVFCFCLSSCCKKTDVRAFEAMNTFMTVRCYGKNAAKANKAVQKHIGQIERLISTTIEESDVYKINHSEGKTVCVSEETYKLADFALNFAKKTEGSFNPAIFPVVSAWGFTSEAYRIPSDEEITNLIACTDFSKIKLSVKTAEIDGTAGTGAAKNYGIQTERNMMIDFGAVGKGFAGDEAIKILSSMGIKSALLDLGGNIQAIGCKPDGKDWFVGVKNPWGGEAVAGIKINNQAVITSGGYERYFTGDDGKKYIHIFNGKTGRPVENELASITIICDSGLYGDALSTSMFVMGAEKAFAFWEQNRDFEMLVITNERKLIYTPGLKTKLTVFDQVDGLEYEVLKE